LNLALVLQERGALAEAIGLYDRILAGELGALPVAESELQAFRERARRDQARLSVTTRGTEVLEVTLDGELMGAVRPGVELTLRVDPGEHTASGTAGARTVEARSFSVSRGEQRAIELTLPDIAPASVAATAPIEQPGEEDDSAVTSAAASEEDDGGSSALPWVLIGGGAALAVAAVVITIVAVSAGGGERYSADPFPNVTALTRP
jgi:hypothetical protein